MSYKYNIEFKNIVKLSLEKLVVLHAAVNF